MAEKKKSAKKAAPVVYDVTDWKFYRPKEIVKVGEFRDGTFLVQSRDGKVKALDEAKFKAEYEPVKGLFKGMW